MASIATQSVQIVPGRIKEDCVATWLVEGGQFFTLIKYSMNTLAYCHGNRTLFYAKPDFMLKADMPEGHAVLGQASRQRLQSFCLIGLIHSCFSERRHALASGGML